MGWMNCENAKTCGHTLCVPEFCKEYEPKKRTNADRIRDEIRTNEGLAELLVYYLDDWGEFDTPIGHFETYEEAIQKTVEWLQQEAT